MSTSKSITKVLTDNRERLAADARFRELQEFYHRKSKEGAVVRGEYTLPQLDTVGRETYNLFAPKRQRRPF